jgi:hypothetical protein
VLAKLLKHLRPVNFGQVQVKQQDIRAGPSIALPHLGYKVQCLVTVSNNVQLMKNSMFR